MPAALTYPGVYVEEIPSGVHTIIGVATSIAAFAGRTAKGPVQEPRTITSYADFERTFGPLSREYPLTYAVRDFYLNGGTTAIILRLWKKDATDGLSRDSFGDLKLKAISEGKWGDKIGIKIETSAMDDAAAQAIDPALTAADFFNLTVVYNGPFGPQEKYLGVTMRTAGEHAIDTSGAAGGAHRHAEVFLLRAEGTVVDDGEDAHRRRHPTCRSRARR